MKTRRTTSNRRKTGRTPGRHHLLELNVRTASLKRQRRRRAGGLVWKVGMVALALFCMAAAARFTARRFFFQNPEYSLRHLEAKLDGVITRERLEELTGFREGSNLFLLDLEKANRSLAALPEVRSVSIEKELPDTVRVTLEKRVPLFLLSNGSEGGESFQPGKSYLCDGEGFLLKPPVLDPEYLELPVLAGMDLSCASPGKRLEDERLSFAISLDRAFSEIPEESFKVRSIDASKGYAAVVMDSTGARFTFGKKDLPAQIQRLRKLLAHCQEAGRRIETANLMLSRNTPVTFVMTPESRLVKITPAQPRRKSVP
jgi:cell division septal protein FtsQ